MTNCSPSSRANFEPSAHTPTADSQGLHQYSTVHLSNKVPLGLWKQPRKAYQRQSAPLKTEEQSTPDLNHDSGSTSASEISIEEAEVHNERSERTEGQQDVQAITTALETKSNPKSEFADTTDADPKLSALEVGKTDHILSSVISTTSVEERESTVSTLGSGTILVPEQDASSLSFPSTLDQQRREFRPLVEVGVRRKPSFYQEKNLPRKTRPTDARHPGTPPKLLSSVREQILQIEHLSHEEKDRILALLTHEWEDYERASEERAVILQKENEELLQKVVVSTSRITQLQAKLDSLRDHPPAIMSQTGEIHSHFTAVTTVLTTLTTRTEYWRQTSAKNTGCITISVTELERLSSDLVASASELQTLVSLQEERDHAFVSLTRETAEKAQQIAAEVTKNELLERNLFIASVRMEKLEQAHDSLSSELVLARNELQTKVSMIDERDHTIVALRKENEEFCFLRNQLRDDLARANQDVSSLVPEVKELKRLGAAKTRELETTQKDLQRLRDELDVASSELGTTTQELTSAHKSLEEWEHSDAVKSRELAGVWKNIAKLQHDLATSSSRIIELEQLNEAQSTELHSLREQLASLSEDRDRIVASLNKEIDDWKLADHGKNKEITALGEDLDQLRHDLTASADQALKDRERLEAESAKLISQIGECRLSEAAKAEELLAAREQLQQLHYDLSTSSTLITELQQRDEMLSNELTSVHKRLEDVSSNSNDKDRMIASLTAEIEGWKQLNVTKTEKLEAARRDVDQLHLDIALEQRRAAELAEELSGAQEKTQQLAEKLDFLSNQLQVAWSSIEEKDSMIATHVAEIELLKLKDVAQAEELIATRNDLEQLHRDLITTQERHVAESVELTAHVEEWKLSDASKAEKLGAAHRDVERLRSELAASTTQIVDVQKRYATESAELVSKVEGLERLNTIQAQDLATASEKITDLENHRATSSSRIIELEQHDKTRSLELSSLHEQLAAVSSVDKDGDHTVATLNEQIAKWKRVDGCKVEEIVTLRKELDSLQRDLAASTKQIVEEQRRHATESGDLTSKIEKWKGSDAAKAQELINAREQLMQLQNVGSKSSSRISELDHQNRSLSAAVDSLRAQYEVASSYCEERDRIVATLSAETEQWKLADVTKGEQLNVIRNELDQVRHVLSTSVTQIQEDRKLRMAETAEFVSEFEEWKCSDVSNVQELSSAYERIEQLEHDRTTSSCLIIELEQHNETQSMQLCSLREQSQAYSSLSGDRDHSVATLAAQIEDWKLADSAKAEELIAARKDLQQLRQEVVIASSRADAAKKELARFKGPSSLRERLTAMLSAGKDRDRTIATMSMQIGKWEQENGRKVEEIITLHEKLSKLRRDLTASTNQIAEEQRRHATESAVLLSKIDKWKGSDAAKAQELINAREQFTQLQRVNSTSSLRITELDQQNQSLSAAVNSLRAQYEAALLYGKERDCIMTNFSTEIEQWKLANIANEEQLNVTRDQLDQLRNALSTSLAQIQENEKHHTTQTAEFAFKLREWERLDVSKAQKLSLAYERIKHLECNQTTQVEGWKQSDAEKEEKLLAAHRDLERLRSVIVQLERRNETQSAQLNSLHEQLEALTLLSGDGARAITILNAQIDHCKLSGTEKAEALNKLRCDLAASTNQIVEDHKHHATELAEVTSQRKHYQLRCEMQLTELDSLRQQLQVALALGEDKDYMITTLKNQLEQWNGADSARLEKLRLARAELEGVWRELLATPTTKEPTPDVDNAALGDLAGIVDGWLRADKDRVQDLAVELADRDKEIAVLKSHLAELKYEYEKHSTALKSAQTQLDNVQRFVTSADNYADTVIIQALQKLNAEVQHSTIIIADFMLEDFQPHAKVTKELVSARERVSELIGQPLTACLGQESADELALYLQIAFQAYLSNHLSWIISSWTLEKGQDDFISEIYDRMQISEPQTVSGRWRSLTRAYIAHDSTSDSAILIADAMKGLFDIVLVAGCATSVSDANSKFLSKFKNKVSGIISLAGKFAKMVGEVASSDFAVLVARPHQIFKEDTMEEDVDDDDKTPRRTVKGQKVVCSTHLGLTKRMQLESGKKTLTVVRTKVVLESFLGS